MLLRGSGGAGGAVEPADARAQALARETSPWQRLQQSSGEDVGSSAGSIRVHADGAAADVADAWGANAFTLGRHVYLSRSAPSADTRAGQSLLRHEIAHAESGGATPTDGAPFAAEDGPSERHARARAQGQANAAAAPATEPRVFRHPVNPTPAARRDRLALLGDGTPANPGATLQDFETYIAQQADWFTEPSLSGADRDVLWRWVLLLQEGPGVGTALGALHLGELAALPAADMPALRAYAAGADPGAETVRITARHSSLARVLELGRALVDLQAFVPSPVLRVCVSQVDLEALVDEGLIGALSDYYRDFQPTLENAAEMPHLLDLLRAGLAAYAPLRGYVRDLHAFTAATRARLAANMSDTSGARPVMLILMSGLDWNAAFLQASNLESAVLNPNNLTLVIQGPTSLASAGTLVTTLADTYGQAPAGGGSRRLGQVVIAGHGASTGVELATPGTGATGVQDQYVSYAEDSLDFRASPRDTEALIDTILSRMDPASARVVFAGCLVGSHEVPSGTDVSDPATAAGNIRAAIAANPNLADFVRSRMVALGVTGDVRAANASTTFGAFGVDASGTADLNLSWDPDIGGTKAQYAASGSEPEGALRAALETWADPALGPAWTTATLRARVAALSGVTGWYESLTRTGYELALPPAPADVPAARLLDLSHRAEAWLLAGWPDTADASRLAAAVHAGEELALYGAMLASDMAGEPHLAVIVHQAWMNADAAHEASFMAAIGASGLSRTALEPLLSRPLVDAHLAALLPTSATPSREQLLLALTIAAADGAAMPRPVADLLRAAAGGARTTTFPAALGVPALLDGASELQLLEDLGLAPGTPSAGGVLDDANADLDDSGMNERFIALRPREATVTAFALNVRSRPRMDDNVIGWLHRGDVVRVMGETHGWSAIDFNGTMAFVYHRFIS